DSDGEHIEEVAGWIVAMKEAFRAALFDDVNVPAAIAAVFRLVRQVNYVMGQGKLCTDCAKSVLEALEDVDQVLAILPPVQEAAELPTEIAALLGEREKARANKDFARADAIREQLQERGYVVEDRVGGMRVRPKADR
ncbi:MAG: CysS/YqeB C-terminal domain-containing protein, partial [Myxococcota bacterium]